MPLPAHAVGARAGQLGNYLSCLIENADGEPSQASRVCVADKEHGASTPSCWNRRQHVVNFEVAVIRKLDAGKARAA